MSVVTTQVIYFSGIGRKLLYFWDNWYTSGLLSFAISLPFWGCLFHLVCSFLHWQNALSLIASHIFAFHYSLEVKSGSVFTAKNCFALNIYSVSRSFLGLTFTSFRFCDSLCLWVLESVLVSFTTEWLTSFPSVFFHCTLSSCQKDKVIRRYCEIPMIYFFVVIKLSWLT